MNAVTPAKVLAYPAVEPPALSATKARSSWLMRRIYDVVGTPVMPNSPPNTPEFRINYATITVLVLVLSAIVGGWVYTWNAAKQVGYELGKGEAERQQLLERVQKTEQDAADQKKLSAYEAGLKDAHAPEKKKSTGKPQQDKQAE